MILREKLVYTCRYGCYTRVLDVRLLSWFSMISQNGCDIFRHAKMDSLKNLEPCSWFKLNPYKEMSISQKCVKGCPTVVQLQISINIWISPWWSNQIRKRFLIWTNLKSLQRASKISYHSPTSGGKSVFPILETSYHNYTDLNNRNFLKNGLGIDWFPRLLGKISVSRFGAAIPRFRRIEISPILARCFKSRMSIFLTSEIFTTEYWITSGSLFWFSFGVRL